MTLSLKAAIYLSFLVVSFDWGMVFLYLIIHVFNSFGASITYEQAGPLFGLGIALVPSLMLPLLFFPDLGHDVFPSQMDLHLELLMRSGRSQSNLARAYRYLSTPEYLRNDPSLTTRIVRAPMLAMLILLVHSCVPIVYWILRGGIVVFSIWFGQFLFFTVGASLALAGLLFRLTNTEQSNYRKWRGFWLNYWIALLAIFRPIEGVRNFASGFKLFSLTFSSKKNNVDETTLLEKKLALVLDYYGLRNNKVPNEWSHSDALDVVLSYHILKESMKCHESLLRNSRVTDALKRHLNVVNGYQDLWSIDDIDEYIRSAGVIITSLTLCEISIPVIEDLMSLDLIKMNAADVSSLAVENYDSIHSLPRFVFPKFSRWLLIAYSLAATMAIALGPVLTQILLTVAPPG